MGVTSTLVYFAVVIGIIIYVLDVLRRIARAAEEMAAAGTRQAQALEILANKRETSDSTGQAPDPSARQM